MIHCPFCKQAAHARTSRYLSESVKHRYYQCTNLLCSASFRSMESVDSIIRPPAEGGEADDFIKAESGRARTQRPSATQ